MINMGYSTQTMVRDHKSLIKAYFGRHNSTVINLKKLSTGNESMSRMTLEKQKRNGKIRRMVRMTINN